MKTTDFIKENFVADAAAAHQDHEVQMARSDCYNAAKYAVELHKLLKNISEQQGLDGWVSEKITLANDYLRTVTEYLRYEQQSDSTGMDEFNPESATQTLDAALGESVVQEDDYDDAVAAFLSKNKPIVGKTHKPRKAERLGGSRHIGGGGEKMKASRTGIGSKPTGKAVVGQASLGEDEEEPQTKRKPAVVKTNKPVGSRVADIGPGGKEYNVKTDKAWDDQHKDVDEGMIGTVSFPDDEGTHTGNNPPVSIGGTFDKRPEVKAGKLVKASGLSGVWRVNDIRGDQASITQEIPNNGMSTYIPLSDLRVWTNKPIKEKDVAEDMSRAAKGNEKYGKDGMRALAKAGREGASEKEMDAIRDKHDKYDEDLSEEAKKGLYYYVNKRKKAGTSRDADHPKAPSPQDWKNAAKTAKKESVDEGHGDSDPLQNRADYAKRHGTGQVYKKTHPGDKTGMSKAYAYDIKRTGPKGALPEADVVEAADKPVHRIGLTVTDPNHPMVSKRKETIQKTVKVSGDDREKAINTAIAHYRRKGYKVHDHHYIGTVDNESIKETAGATGSASIATTPGGKSSKNAGTLFGGEFQQRTPFTAKKKK